MLLNELVSTILQVLVFALIPFIVHLIRARTARGFFAYVGLVPTTRRAIMLALLTSVLFVVGALTIVLWSDDIRAIMTVPPSVTGKLRQMGAGPEAVSILLLIALIKTAFAEELFFRGFVARRLIAWLGYRLGNLLQAFLFALLHALLFFALTGAGVFFMVFIFSLTFLAAYIIGHIKEHIGKGSILPGWVAHGVGNLLSYTIIAYWI